ncbi:ISLre2 family transposase [Clostridium tyrobutyricum]|jgi:hypothetical protein|uniref:ISLre2 family transposase n=1 Tax=Clostridium tyrobutyricum TaxID=1519 RepID=UPI001C3911B0|nr:ISLre2 family transposase [Clostridium tyrobutyricum]MBV4448557.1 ISLre2 family transposase [Clostridium tyrobutyricum]MCI1651172.1 ISLre2 family transposase [Clostridium tyrobutyricum]MCI1653067.1 ISLre2 family transposase [Clostridium tyrobutyricum]
MYEISLNDENITFKGLEKKIYEYVCNLACSIMGETLDQIDKRLMAERDTRSLRDKGKRHTCIKTIMGNVEIDRRIYEYSMDSGKKAYKYLLDEFLGMDTIGHMSMNLVENIISNVTEISYRKTAKNIKLMCNQDVSHTAVWNVVQNFGRKLKERDERKVELSKQEKLNGKKEVKVLFQEQDGIWLNIQGKDKPKKGKNKKKELKLGISYEGWKKRKSGKNEYVVENKLVCASFGSARTFKELSKATVEEVYNMDEIDTRIINGDGAAWIKASIEDEGVYYQLDPFHKSQAVLRAVNDKQEAKKLIDLLHKGKVSESLNSVEQLMIKNNADEKEMKKLSNLYNYLVNNKEGLIPYHLRKDIKLPEPPEGLKYRHLGTMEHNICDVLAQRMKGRKMSWSIIGAENMAKIQAERFSNRLYKSLDELCNSVLTKEKFDKIEEIIVLSAAEVNKNIPKSKTYAVHKGKVPFTGSAITNGRKAIRRIFEDRCFSELVYR